MPTRLLYPLCLLLAITAPNRLMGQKTAAPKQIFLSDGWQLKSSVLVPEDGARVSTVDYTPQTWLSTTVPSTVLSALVKNGVYPNPREGFNCYQIPDSSDVFNEKHDLARFSYLPDQRNPWRDPYWYRTEFKLSQPPPDGRVWLEFKGINYRADVWLNGQKVTALQQMAGMFLRFRLEVTQQVKAGRNCLAVLVYPVDHPGEPDTQWEVLGPERGFQAKELMKDVTMTMNIGYDCMPTIPDRNIGLWQEVAVDITGPVDLRHPFVVTDLPLPKTDPASLSVSVDLVNASSEAQTGVLRGVIEELGVEFSKKVELAPGETKRVVCGPDEFHELLIQNPKLWWPRNYGGQNLHHLKLTFEAGGGVSDSETVTFGIRKVTSDIYQYKGTPGLRVHVNGQRVAAQGGWLQPDMLLDSPAARIEAEVRYLAEANFNTVTFEDLPAPNDAFLEACDRLGLMYWCCFYGSDWISPGKGWPLDRDLLAKCGVDIIKRYRNHPSLILYSCAGEFNPDREVYLHWRQDVRELDGTRLLVPTIDVRKVEDWFKEELPTGLHDDVAFNWREPATYYQNVRDGGKWVFNTEVGFGSLPPFESLRRFLPNVFDRSQVGSKTYPLDKIWAHHGANHYYKDYDAAIRRLYGEPDSVMDYCMKAHLVTATQHRAWSEAVNHRLWDITSGIWEWKINSCWPDVNWQIYDWYLRPMVSLYYYRLAFEPLHVQLSPLDSMVAVINRRAREEKDLAVDITAYDSESKVRWQRSIPVSAPGDSYRDVQTIPALEALTPVYFVVLKLRNATGEAVSQNFYWLTANEPSQYRELSKLPPIHLKASCKIKKEGKETVVRARVENPSDRIAFFIHVALTRSQGGEEILPVFWDDNFFSLPPHSIRELTARLATRDLKDAQPVLEAGGWNIRTDYDCASLKCDPTQVKVGEEVTMTAVIKHTFLDGSRVFLEVDDQATVSQWAWARGGRKADLKFSLKPDQPGRHEIRVGNQKLELTVRP